MSAHVARVNPHHLRDKENSRVVMEWVKRNEALLAECEWDWTTDREEAYAWRDYECAERWIHGTRGAERESGAEERFYGAYACTSGAPALDMPPRRQRSGPDGRNNFASGGAGNRRSATGKSEHAATPRKSDPLRRGDCPSEGETDDANAGGDVRPVRRVFSGARRRMRQGSLETAPPDVYERTERRCGS